MKKKNNKRDNKPRVVISYENAECRIKAQQLSESLNLPLETYIEALPFLYVLMVTPQRLELRVMADNHSPTLSKIYVEFLKGPLGYRREKGGGLNQLIARALGLRGRRQKPFVVDATAGFGQDGFILASLGCKVLMIERSPIIAALLADGLARAGSQETQSPFIHEQIELRVGEASVIFKTLAQEQVPDIIYLDPMFPTREKSALVKIEMRAIRDIVGFDADAQMLLYEALKLAKERVVVKRPRLGEPLLPYRAQDFSVFGKKNRYDIYLNE